MHIKRIIVEGFKSYRDRQKIPAKTEFVEGHCVVVGRNGSGKSNFFDAIMFVLSDRNSRLTREQRQKLIHDEGGAAGSRGVSTAFVEIVFDNSDNRLTVDPQKAEVRLRRTIGMKEDVYRLNNKIVQRSEVVQLLESAGFSSSNPYYAVRQGEVRKLCTMTDERRLDLLKEVAGTNVYDERKAESLAIMETTNARLEKVNGVIAYINERLGELNEEKDELAAYLAIEKQRRAIQYTLYEKERQKAAAKMDKLKDERDELNSDARPLHEATKRHEASLAEAEEELGALTGGANGRKEKERELVRLNTEYDAEHARASKLELEVQDLRSSLDVQLEQRERLQATIDDVAARVAAAKSELEGDVGPRFERSVAARRGAAGELSEMQQRISALGALAGRHAQFKSAQERDAWVAKELKTVESRASAKESAVSRVRAKRVKVGARIAASEARIAQCASELPAKEAELRTTNTARTMGEAELDTLIDTRKGLWHKADGVLKQIRAQQDAAKKWQERFDRTRPRHVTTAMQSLRRIMQAARDASESWVGEVHGPLIELFELDGDKFTTAVELTAHNALFNIVVDTEATATRLIERLRREKGGRLTFMPLDRIRATGTALPPPEQASFVPLIDKISFDPVVAKAMQQVFGQTLLCRSREIAAQYAREYKIDCITLDGDQVNRRGALVGGYFDARSCRLKAHKQAGEARKAHVAIEREQKEIKRDLELADRAILAARGEVEKQRALAATLRLSVNELRKERERLNRRLRADKAEDTGADELASDEAELDELQSKIEALRAERGTPLVSKLSNAQQKELNAAEKALPKLKAVDAAAETALEGALEKKRALEALLHSNLQRQLDELRQQLEEGGGDGDASQGKESGMLADERASVLASKEEALARAVAATTVAEERLDAGREGLDAVRQRFHAAEARCEEARSQLARLVDQRQRQEKEFERLVAKIRLEEEKHEDATRKIRECPHLSREELANFRETKRKALLKALEDRNEKLKKFSHINKKALGQFEDFNTQKEELEERKKELDAGAESIQELIQSLDERKDEAINRTFTDVGKYFADVFEELVPHGSGKLKIVRRLAAAADADDDGDVEAKVAPSAAAAVRVSHFSGIRVLVDFTGGGEEFQMQQLSGGQQTLVALTLIFAIQRCDPAPFYLLDEIDQALDSTHRKAVADLIQRQAVGSSDSEGRPCQFVTSTFHPEQVSIATQWLGVAHQHRVSSIREMQQTAAASFVEKLQQSEGGDAPAARGRSGGRV